MAGSRWKAIFPVGHDGGNDVRKIRAGPAAVGETVTSTKKKNASAAAVDEFANKFLLRQGEIAGFHGAENESLIREEVFSARGKSFGKFIGVADALAINFVFGGAQHGSDLHDAVVILGAANEFVFPARLAFDVQHAAFARLDVHQARHRIIGLICFAGHGVDAKLQGFCARGARVEEQAFALDFVVRTKGDVVRGQNIRAVAHSQRRLAPCIPPLMKTHARGKTRIGQRARSDDGVVDSTSLGICSSPKPTVCTGMRRLRSAEIVSGSTPPELSEPSLSNTTAPTGRSDVSEANCLRLSPMRVAGAVGGACKSFESATRVSWVSKR